MLLAGSVQAQTFRTLYKFSGTSDGLGPSGTVLFDSQGNMYGTAHGFSQYYGTAWKIDSSGNFTPLHLFDSIQSGYYPCQTVALDSAGNLYGADSGPGINFYYGNVWKIDKLGVYTPIYTFTDGSDGSQPVGGVTLGPDGYLYGMTQSGGANKLGTVWKSDTSGNLNPVYTFHGGAEGSGPLGTVAFDTAGNMYGTNYGGGILPDGSNGGGTVWKIDTLGSFSVLHTFTYGADGANPQASVRFDSAGNMYGTASSGGAYGWGTVWKINTAGAFSVVHPFTDGSDGGEPNGNITFDSAGNMYGTAGIANGPFNESGTIWKISPSGVFSTIYLASAPTGYGPAGDVTVDSTGNLYGTFVGGGIELPHEGYCGTIWQISPGNYSLKAIGSSPNVLVGGGTSTGTVYINGVAPGLGLTVNLASNDPNFIVPATVTIPAGANKMTFPITTLAVFATDSATITGTYQSQTVSMPMTLAATDALHYIVVNPGSVTGGVTTSGTVYLNASAPIDAYVTLSSSDPSAQFPINPVKISAGNISANFTITTSPAYSVTPINISATLGPKTVNCGLLLGVTDSVHYVTALPNSVTGGGSSTGTVYLTSPAPAGGTFVTISSSSPDLQVSSPAYVLAGQQSATFTITTSGVFAAETVSIYATLGSKTVSCGFGIGPSAVLHAVTISPSSVIGGIITTGTVTLNGPAPIGGAIVSLSSSDPSAKVLSTVTVLEGQTSANFLIATTPVQSNTNPQISATLNGVSRSCGLIVAAPQLVSFHVSQTTIAGGNTATVTVTISGPAPTGGTTITLGSTSGYATLPSTLVIPAGATLGTATLSTTTPGGILLFAISATLGAKTDSINMILQI